jgi:lipid II:glycine glycyltransferase (peptidoglycan interpeptide bridge formation enzyme)
VKPSVKGFGPKTRIGLNSRLHHPYLSQDPTFGWYNAAVTSELSQDTWDEFLDSQPQAHILQTSSWGLLKESFGWRVIRLVSGGFGAQLLIRKLAPGILLGYIPKGPIGDLTDQNLNALIELCRIHRISILKIEPDDIFSDPEDIEALKHHGFRPSVQTIQPSRTLVVDLKQKEDEILARMNQKTRYNIRLAMRKGVSVRPWTDVQSFSKMMQLTAERDEFGAHSFPYYQKAYDLFNPLHACELLVAEVEGEALAAIMIFSHGERAWYFYGASTGIKRNLMPNYLLQWEAMKWAKAKGCVSYDLWGVPDYPLDDLEAQFTERNDGLWGVYRFKRGFGGDLIQTAGAWDQSLNPLKYQIYSIALRMRGR